MHGAASRVTNRDALMSGRTNVVNQLKRFINNIKLLKITHVNKIINMLFRIALNCFTHGFSLCCILHFGCDSKLYKAERLES